MDDPAVYASAQLFIELQVFGRNGAKDFLGTGLPACDPKQRSAGGGRGARLLGLLAELSRAIQRPRNRSAQAGRIDLGYCSGW